MYNIQVKEAKKQFIESGRLNHKIINENISKSWYKCFLVHLKVDTVDLKNMYKFDYKKNISSDMRNLAMNICDKYGSVIIADSEGCVISSRITDKTLENINHLDEQYIGTNAGIIAIRTEKAIKISLEEHYLNVLCEYYSVGIPIKVNEQLVGVCLIFTAVDMNEIDIFRIESQLKISEEEKTSVKPSLETGISLSQLFSYPDDEFERFDKHVERLLNVKYPILVMGSQGSGKTALSLYIALKIGENYKLLNIREIPQMMQYNVVYSSLSQNGTVIIENFELLDNRTSKLLTVYTDEMTNQNKSDKYSDFKCKNLILTTVYTTVNELYDLNVNQRIIEKSKLNHIILKNLDQFKEERCKLVNTVLKKHDMNCTEEYVDKLLKHKVDLSYKDVVQSVQISCLHSRDVNVYNSFHLDCYIDEKPQSYEEMERDYIIKMLKMTENNITLAAELMKIGRSTLYRKIEKYQIDTNQ